MSFVTLPE